MIPTFYANPVSTDARHQELIPINEPTPPMPTGRAMMRMSFELSALAF